MPLLEVRTDAVVLSAEGEEAFTIVQAAAAVFCPCNDRETFLAIISNCKSMREIPQGGDDEERPSIESETKSVLDVPAVTHTRRRRRLSASSNTEQENLTTYPVFIEIKVWRSDSSECSVNDSGLRRLLDYIMQKTRFMTLFSSHPGSAAQSPKCSIYDSKTPRGYAYDHAIFEGQSLTLPDESRSQHRLLEYCNNEILSIGAFVRPGTRRRSSTTQSRQSTYPESVSSRVRPSLSSQTSEERSTLSSPITQSTYTDPDGQRRLSSDSDYRRSSTTTVNAAKLHDQLCLPGSLCGSVLGMLQSHESAVQDPKDEFRKLTSSSETIDTLTPDGLLAQIATTKIPAKPRRATLCDLRKSGAQVAEV